MGKSVSKVVAAAKAAAGKNTEQKAPAPAPELVPPPPPAPPAPPVEVKVEKVLDLTDPKRKLTAEERELLTPEQKKARRLARKKSRPPVSARLARQIGRFIKRVSRIEQMTGGGKAASEALKLLGDHVVALKPDWKPGAVSEKAAPAGFEQGSVVRFRDSKQAQYEALLSKEDMERLVVQQVLDKRLILLSPSGAKLFLPSAHFEAAKPVVEAPAEEPAGETAAD